MASETFYAHAASNAALNSLGGFSFSETNLANHGIGLHRNQSSVWDLRNVMVQENGNHAPLPGLDGLYSGSFHGNVAFNSFADLMGAGPGNEANMNQEWLGHEELPEQHQPFSLENEHEEMMENTKATMDQYYNQDPLTLNTSPLSVDHSLRETRVSKPKLSALGLANQEEGRGNEHEQEQEQGQDDDDDDSSMSTSSQIMIEDMMPQVQAKPKRKRAPRKRHQKAINRLKEQVKNILEKSKVAKQLARVHASEQAFLRAENMRIRNENAMILSMIQQKLGDNAELKARLSQLPKVPCGMPRCLHDVKIVY